jgi:hypothetical protein
MRTAVLGLAAAPAVLLLAPAAAGAGSARAPVSLAASPSRVTMVGSGRTEVRLTNAGIKPVEVEMSRATFALDLRGRPRIVPRGRGRNDAAGWLTVRPRKIALRSRATGSLTISSSVPRGVRPGDHGALVLLTTRPIRGARVAVRMRLGVVVVVRAPGRVARRLELRRLRVRRVRSSRVLELYVANRGNVTEVLHRGRVTITLRRGGRILARLHTAPRELLPRTTGIAQARYAGRARGRATALVELSYDAGRTLRRAFAIGL